MSNVTTGTTTLSKTQGPMSGFLPLAPVLPLSLPSPLASPLRAPLRRCTPAASPLRRATLRAELPQKPAQPFYKSAPPVQRRAANRARAAKRARRVAPPASAATAPGGGSSPARAGAGAGAGGSVGASRAHLALVGAERVQKVLSRLGVLSRRAAEAAVAAGRVRVNGQLCTPGQAVDVRRDTVSLDGLAVTSPSSSSSSSSSATVVEQAIWLAIHKPRGVSADTRTPTANGRGRGLPAIEPRVARDCLVVVDRIEAAASGLLLVTNERGVVARIGGPHNGFMQTWVVDCIGIVPQKQVRVLRDGVTLGPQDPTPMRADVDVVGSERVEISRTRMGWMTRLEVRLRDHRHHAVRRLCEAGGLDVAALRRLSFGPVLLGSLKVGESRGLLAKEVKALKRGVQQSKPRGSGDIGSGDRQDGSRRDSGGKGGRRGD